MFGFWLRLFHALVNFLVFDVQEDAADDDVRHDDDGDSDN